jgi:3-oxoadipate enol-lactonase
MPHATAADGTRIAYQVQGQGAPLVLLAGQANNHHWWDAVRADFHATRSTLTLDYRGTGDSDRPDQSFSTQGFADDVVSVLDHLGIDRADVYGTSMGGRVAQWVAIRYPDRVRHLVLGCTSPGGSHSIGPDRSIDEALAVADPKAIETALLDLMYASDPPTTSQLLGDPNMPAYARRRHRIASRRHDAWDHLPHIQARTLVIHGTADRFTPAANASLLAERIPQAHLHLIDQARHAYFEEFRHVASPRVLDFLATA